jgi:hypothetical protein
MTPDILASVKWSPDKWALSEVLLFSCRIQTHEVEIKLNSLAQYQHMAEALFAHVRTVDSSLHGKLKVELVERLTALLLKVDAVETEGRYEIRNVRKQVVFIIQSALNCLESCH